MDPSSTLQWKLGSVRFGGRGQLSVERDAKNIATEAIREMWVSGDLPKQQGKQWIVGYDCYVTFFSVFVRALTVGPAKPSKFRDRYAKATASIKI